jgi:hypothetical protein
MKKALLLFTAAVTSVLLMSGCAAQMATYTDDAGNILLNRQKTALYLPIDSLRVTYMDNTKSIPDTLFNDSFFIEAANGLLLYEVAKNFAMCQSQADSLDSLWLFRRSSYSRLTADTVYLQYISHRIQALAARHNADLVIVPYSCAIRHVTIRPAGWRQDRFGPAYERPISYTAKTAVHVQIWDKTGRIIYERIGKSDTGRPILYSILKKEKNRDSDIVKYAKRFYAPPLVKSLYNSIKLAVMVRM